jgi:hypothetical protein
MTNINPFGTLEKALSLEPQQHYEVVPSTPKTAEEERFASTADYIESRIKDTVDSLDDAIQKVNAIGELSEAPGAYRVIGELANAKISALKELRELRKVDKKSIQVGTVNNTQVNAPAAGMNLNDILKALGKK